MAQTFLPILRVRRAGVGTTTVGGNQLWISLPDLSTFPSTSLTTDYASGVTALVVFSNVGFATNDYVLLGEIGDDETEIVKITVSGTTFTASSATAFPHARGTSVRLIPFNQVSIERATTLTGSYSEVTAIALTPDKLETFYADNTQASTVAYKVRFKNVQNTTFSDYSDAVLATGYADNSVWSIKNRALRQLGEKMEGMITDELLNEALWEGRRELDQERKRWSFRTTFNSDIGNVTTGAYSVAVPSTLRAPDSPQNILGLRIGREGYNMRYLTKSEWDEYFQGVAHTTVATQPSVGATSLVLTDSRDFDDSGTITIASNTITYTTNTVSTGTLSGIPASGTGSIDTAHAVGVDVWQFITFGLPDHYTIFEDTIYFNRPFSSTYSGRNIFMDLYRTMPEYNSDNDTLDEPQFDLFVSFLKWKIKYLKSKGKIKAETDSDYLEWVRRKQQLLRVETLNQRVEFVPDVSHLLDEGL